MSEMRPRWLISPPDTARIVSQTPLGVCCGNAAFTRQFRRRGNVALAESFGLWMWREWGRILRSGGGMNSRNLFCGAATVQRPRESAMLIGGLLLGGNWSGWVGPGRPWRWEGASMRVRVTALCKWVGRKFEHEPVFRQVVHAWIPRNPPCWQSQPPAVSVSSGAGDRVDASAPTGNWQGERRRRRRQQQQQQRQQRGVSIGFGADWIHLDPISWLTGRWWMVARRPLQVFNEGLHHPAGGNRRIIHQLAVDDDFDHFVNWWLLMSAYKSIGLRPRDCPLVDDWLASAYRRGSEIRTNRMAGKRKASRKRNRKTRRLGIKRQWKENW